jgi:hypothetical protein
MPLDHVEAFNYHAIILRQSAAHFAFLTTILASDDEDGVVLLDLHFTPPPEPAR